MNLRGFLFMTVLAASPMVWGVDSQKNLTQARSEYRQAVARHGANSLEARKARQNLRTTRRSFHAERRQRKKE